jgi:hypothetical protein
MSYSATAAGNWSTPVLVQPGKCEMDSNMACVIKEDGSLVGMWRDHYPGGKHSTPHLVTATDWKVTGRQRRWRRRWVGGLVG